MILTVAVVQMVATAEVAENLAAAALLLDRAAAQGARLVLLPENFALMGRRETDKLAIMEADGEGPIQDWLAAQARRLGLWLVGGSMPLAAGDGRCHAACLVYDEHGKRRARYDKIHLFDVDLGGGESYRESRSIAPGKEPVHLLRSALSRTLSGLWGGRIAGGAQCLHPAHGAGALGCAAACASH